MTHTITIDSINSDGTLELSDSGDTIAKRGDTIQWIIDHNSGVASITGIQDNSNIDVFDPNPALANAGGMWSGLINPNLDLTGGTCEEMYTILYTRASDNIERVTTQKFKLIHSM